MNAMYQVPQTSGNHWSSPADYAHQWSVVLPKPNQEIAILVHLEQQMVEFAAEYDATLNQVRRHFVFPADSTHLLTFFSAHRTIPQILLQAVAPLRACFGEDAVFNLRAPIDESGSQNLYAVAMWPGNLRDVRQALATFDNTWWLAQSQQAHGYLSFTYELV